MSSPSTLPFSLWIMSKIWKGVLLRLILKQDGTFNRKAADFFDRQIPASNEPLDGVSTEDITIDSSTDLWVRVFTPVTPDSNSKLPVIFYFHGGFFALLTPSTKTVDSMCRKLSKDSNSIIISVNYRRIPEHKYPAAIDDGYTTVKWFQSEENAGNLEKADFSNSFLVGDSAGGNLVYNLTCKLAEAGEGSLSPVVIRGQVLIQPSFGGEEATESEVRFGDGVFADRSFSEWRWKVYLPEGADRGHPGCNPVGSGLTSMTEKWISPTMVVVGGYCPGQSRQRELVEKMKAAGKEAEVVFFPEAVHAFYLFPSYALAQNCHEEVAKFIKSHVN